MPRLPGASADEMRGLVPAVRESWAEIEANVLRSGVADQALKDLCYRFLAGELADVTPYDGRERLALEWAQVIAYGSDSEDHELWRRLHDAFSEPELVDLGCAIGFELGRQHWALSVGLAARGA